MIDTVRAWSAPVLNGEILRAGAGNVVVLAGHANDLFQRILIVDAVANEQSLQIVHVKVLERAAVCVSWTRGISVDNLLAAESTQLNALSLFAVYVANSISILLLE